MWCPSYKLWLLSIVISKTPDGECDDFLDFANSLQWLEMFLYETCYITMY
jgi:hypothetical protein